jgi:hypothetical protein
MADSPFDSLESAQEYVRLLASEVEDAQTSIQGDITEADRDRAVRRLDALQIVDYKLKQLAHHMSASGRILNDLKMLRRLLVSDEALTPRTSRGRRAAPGGPDRTA